MIYGASTSSRPSSGQVSINPKNLSSSQAYKYREIEFIWIHHSHSHRNPIFATAMEKVRSQGRGQKEYEFGQAKGLKENQNFGVSLSLSHVP